MKLIGIWFVIVNMTSQSLLAQTLEYSKSSKGLNKPESERFSPLKSSLVSLGKDPAWHWHKVTISNNSDHQKNFFYEIAIPWLDSAKFFDEAGQLKYALSSLTPLNERLYYHQNFILPISLERNQDTTIYSAFQKKTMLINGHILVSEQNAFARKQGFDHLFFGAFAGLCLVISTFSAFMWLVSKEKIYAYYCFYIVFYMIYFLALFGYLRAFSIQYNSFIKAAELKDWALWISNLSLLFFIKSFLLEGQTLKKGIKWFYRICLFLFTSIFFQRLLWFYFEEYQSGVPNVLLLLVTFSYFSSIICGLVIIIYALKNRINTGATKLYLLGVSPLLIFSILSYFRNMGLLPHGKLMSEYIQIACVVFDILVLMLALSFRYRKVVKEKQEKEKLALLSELKFLKEKERISRDLHDHVGSQLTILSTGLENATYLAEHKTLDAEKIENLNQNTKQAIQSLRDSIWASQSEEISIEGFKNRLKDYLQKSIPETLEWEVNLINSKDQILNSETALTAFRVIQEAIQNILKHAKASEIGIQIEADHQKISIWVSDNGIGIQEPLPTKQTDHFGLINMKSRVHNLNGHFELIIEKDKGITIYFTLPMN